MSRIDQVKDSVDTVFKAQDRFEETISYTPPGGSASDIKATVIDDFDLTDDGGLDRDFIDGMSSVVHVYVSETDVAQPQYEDQITWSGKSLNVYQFKNQVGMWHLICTTDRRIGY